MTAKRPDPGIILLWCALLLAAVPVGLFTWWAFLDDLMPVTQTLLPDQAATDDDPHDGQGRRRLAQREAFQIERELCSPRELTVGVHRTMTDGVVYSIPDSTTVVLAGCNRRTAQVPVPTSLPPNVWFRYDATLRRCNPIRCAELRLVPYWVAFEGPWPPSAPTAAPEVAPL